MVVMNSEWLLSGAPVPWRPTSGRLCYRWCVSRVCAQRSLSAPGAHQTYIPLLYPTVESQLFDAILRIIGLICVLFAKGLQDPKDATFKRYFYLLEVWTAIWLICTGIEMTVNLMAICISQNLAWVKSFNICIELEDSQSIFAQLFSLIFKVCFHKHLKS